MGCGIWGGAISIAAGSESTLGTVVLGEPVAVLLFGVVPVLGEEVVVVVPGVAAEDVVPELPPGVEGFVDVPPSGVTICVEEICEE